MPNDVSRAIVPILERSRLLTAEQFAQASAEFSATSDSRGAIRRLVERDWITAWQGQMLLAGRSSFFLGKYKLLDLLGQGGMGAVYKAEQTALGRVVALKVMASQILKDHAAVSRFQREIQAASALTHPNIVVAFDADCVGDTHFLVMEYVPGESLDFLVRCRGPLPIPEACEYIRQAALGLQEAFERGMVHRDIKPGNLLLTKDPHGSPLVKVLDFGLARFTSDSAEEGALTQTGQVMGTPDYIAPEQARRTKSADIRSDIFSLGCTLFRLLTGRVPFGGENVMEKLMARALVDAPRLRTVLPGAPAELEQVIAKMLARNSADRYQTPRDVVQALAPFASGSAETLSAPAVSHSGSTQTISLPDLHGALAGAFGFAETGSAAVGGDTRRLDGSQRSAPRRKAARGIPRSAVLATVGLAAVVSIVAAGFAFWQYLGATTLVIDWPPGERARGRLEIDGREVPLETQGELQFSGSPGMRSAALERPGYQPIRKAWNLSRGQFETYRPEWIATPETVRKQLLAELNRETESVLKAGADRSAVLPLSARIASFRQGTSNWRDREQAAGLLRRLPGAADSLRRETIPEHDLRAAGHGDPVDAAPSIVAILGGGRLRPWSGVAAIGLSANGRTLMHNAWSGVGQWDAVSGRLVRWRHLSRAYTLRAAAWSQDARTLLTSTDNTLFLARLEADGVRWAPEGNSGPGLQRLAVNSDGSQVALFIGDGTVHLANPETPGDRRPLAMPDPEKTGADWRHVCFSPDDTLLVALGREHRNDQEILAVWQVGDGKRLRTIPTGKSESGVAVGPGRLAALWTQTAALWNLDTGEVVREFPLQPWQAGISDVRFSPDGELIALGDAGGVVTLRRVADGSEVAQLSGSAYGAKNIVFSADGRTLAFTTNRQIEVFRQESSGTWTPLDRGPEVLAAFVTPAGIQAAVEWHRNRVSLIDVVERKPVWTLPQDFPRLPWVEASPSGRWLATGAPNATARIIDVATGEQRWDLFGSVSAQPVRFSPDERLLATWDGLLDPTHRPDVRIWDLETGRLKSVFSPESPAFLEFSLDGKTLGSLAYSGALIHRWDLRTEKPLPSLKPGFEGLNSFAFHEDGVRVALGNDWGAAAIWDLAESKQVRELYPRVESTAYVGRVAFSPDGRRVAVASGDGCVAVVDLQSDFTEPEFRWQVGPPPRSNVDRVQFLPDSRHLVCHNPNGTIYILRVEEWKP